MARARHHQSTGTVPPVLLGLMARASAAVPRHTGPRLSRSQNTALGLVHDANIQQLIGPNPEPPVLWDWAAALLTWSYAASVLELGEPEMDMQLHLAATVLRRFKATGVLQLHVAEKALAKQGAAVCDAIAAETPQALALDAALWSEAQILVIRASFDAGCDIAIQAHKAQKATA